MADLPPQQPGVLVVDNDPSLLTLLYLALHDHGLTVWTAADGEQAVQVYRKHHKSILAVLLDQSATVTALRRINPGVRCCLVSDTVGRLGKSSPPAPDGVEVLQKPFGFGRLVQVLLRLATARAG
jgi:CheY-like chemotaxis protein